MEMPKNSIKPSFFKMINKNALKSKIRQNKAL